MQWPEGDFPVGNCPDDRGVAENPGDARGGGFLMMSVSDEGEWDVSSPKTVLVCGGKALRRFSVVFCKSPCTRFPVSDREKA